MFENPRALPGAWLAPAVLTGDQRGVARCAGQVVPWLDASDQLRLPDALPRGATCEALAPWLGPLGADGEGLPASPARSGSARIETFRDEMLAVRVEAPAPSLLVISENALPGWRAFVDGVETAVLHADGALRACAVPAGQHRVVFSYATPGLRAGAWVSAASAALLVLLLARARRRSA